MSWLTFALSYAGVACFGLAMSAHHRAVFGRAPDARRVRRFRLGGSSLVLAALITACTSHGWQIGATTWVAMLATSGFALTQLFTYAPRFALVPAAVLLVPTALVSLFQ